MSVRDTSAAADGTGRHRADPGRGPGPEQAARPDPNRDPDPDTGAGDAGSAGATTAATTTGGARPDDTGDRVDGGAGDADGRAGGPAPSLAVRLACVLALVGLATVLVVTAIARGPELSLFDEATHADYAYQIARGHVPAKGDLIAPEILDEWSCHGTWDRKPLPPCGGSNPPRRYTAGGENYNTFHPPTYYLLTGLAARAVDAVRPGGPSFITAARLVGLVWLLAGMGVLYLALRRLGAARPYALLGCALLPLIPTILHSDATVTNDAPAALAGALALLMLARILVGRRTGWLLPAIATLAMASTKMLNALPFLILAALLLLRAVLDRRDGDRRQARRLATVAVAIGVAFLVAYEGWALYQAGRGVADWVNPIRNISGKPVRGLPFDELLSTSFTGFPLTAQFYLQPGIAGSWITVWNRLLTALVVASPFVAVVASRRWTPAWTVGIGTLAGMLLYPLVVELQVYISSGQYFPSVLVRYGITLIPWAVAGLVLVASARELRRTAAALIAAAAVVMVGTITGLI